MAARLLVSGLRHVRSLYGIGIWSKGLRSMGFKGIDPLFVGFEKGAP